MVASQFYTWRKCEKCGKLFYTMFDKVCRECKFKKKGDNK